MTTKGELRRARRTARAEGKPLTGELSLPQDNRRDTQVFSESPQGYRALQRWARFYDELSGAPENDYDR
jgi:hypothetical protein